MLELSEELDLMGDRPLRLVRLTGSLFKGNEVERRDLARPPDN